MSLVQVIVAELRKLVETASRAQFTSGDYALKVEPMREHGGASPTDELFTVKASLFRPSEDIGMSCSSVKQARWTASKWPKDRRVSGVSFTAHNILASLADDEERWATILTPPPDKSRWTPDEARRRTGRQVAKPVTPQEKVSAIHTLAQDEKVSEPFRPEPALAEGRYEAALKGECKIWRTPAAGRGLHRQPVPGS
ncbi:DUF6192 family protein [Streptomyces sp. NBC_01142]|uniref:DUF6192 family protein n=1 Tax=Streptomyces sp. NBC_01142 TaxID=2975865 RepID=UPI00225C2513|nr:DUF6192 family protein [Streptomyces sp. NBC_01142]MCX4821565.1 DUF6192 family protein [Streptomyces sp. NBC_01142]